jgi:hypothetical protein
MPALGYGALERGECTVLLFTIQRVPPPALYPLSFWTTPASRGRTPLAIPR